MKNLGVLIFTFILLFCSCNNNNNPDLEIELSINSAFIPASIAINKDEIDEQEQTEIMNLINNKHIVNDVSEIPNDPIGHNEAFYDINYNEQTLLIMYLYDRWTFETYSNRFYKNTQENSYNWVVKLGTTGEYDKDNDVMQLTRFAILVRKLPTDADVQTWYSLTPLAK